MKKFGVVVGKRKRAVARCHVKEGEGRVFINNVPLEKKFTSLCRMMINEPFKILGNDGYKNYDFFVNVRGGGIIGQSQAIRQSIAKSLVKLFGERAKRAFLKYDRHMLVSDVRRTEPHKPSRSSQGPRRRKQLSKR